jgi:hypothetical protein
VRDDAHVRPDHLLAHRHGQRLGDVEIVEDRDVRDGARRRVVAAAGGDGKGRNREKDRDRQRDPKASDRGRDRALAHDTLLLDAAR